MSKILLVDNEASILSVLGTVLKTEGFEVRSSRDVQSAMDLIKAEEFDLLISDIRMAPLTGMDLLKWVRNERPNLSVIMLTAYGSIETAIEAMKLGAFDYVTKPFKVDELMITIERALSYKNAINENIDLKAQLRTRYRFENIVAESPSMKNVCEMIERIAPTDTTVLIYGESGTGKELVAKAIHSLSRRRNTRFLAVNCAALPEALLESEMFGHVKGSFTGASANKKGLFESVEGGTIFLDEIGAVSMNIQGKLLRVLQEKEVRKVGSNENIPVDARVLAATNTRLEDLIAQGKFREDLYYRLNVVPITIEPLRNRREDILPLANHFLRLELGNSRTLPRFTPEVAGILERYAWPGNVREMENAIKHCLTFSRGDEITPEVLPPRIVAAVGDISGEDPAPQAGYRFESLKAFLRKKEQHYLQRVITGLNGDKEKAATTLKISLATLYRKLSDEDSGDDTEPRQEDVRPAS
jgi:DNA-binding NtrC family response regulator